jgi:multiple antibiotic resistance protein
MEEFSFIFTVFFMLLGPIKLIPSFSGVTRGTDVRFKRSVAIWGVVIASVLCAFVALSGETLLGRYRISIDAVRIAGGLVLMISALLAIFQKAQPPSPGTGTPTAVQLAQLAASPVAVPGIVPPARCATLPASTASAS